MEEIHRAGVRYVPLRPRGPQLELTAVWRLADESPLLAAFLGVLDERVGGDV
jgi:hypothetical protein